MTIKLVLRHKDFKGTKAGMFELFEPTTFQAWIKSLNYFLDTCAACSFRSLANLVP